MAKMYTKDIKTGEDFYFTSTRTEIELFGSKIEFNTNAIFQTGNFYGEKKHAFPSHIINTRIELFSSKSQQITLFVTF